MEHKPTAHDVTMGRDLVHVDGRNDTALVKRALRQAGVLEARYQMCRQGR